MELSLSQWVGFLGSAAGPAAILGIMLSRGLRDKFPMYFNYLAVVAFSTLLAIIVSFYSCPGYFYVYWILNLSIMVLEFGVLYEVLVNLLKPYSALIDLIKMLSRWAALFLLLASLLTAFATNSTHVGRELATAAMFLQRTLRLMQCGLLLLILLFEKRFGLAWRSYGMSVALGLGAYAALDLIVSLLQARGSSMPAALETVNALGYAAVMVFWFFSLLSPEPASKRLLDAPGRLIFQRWNESLASTPFAGSADYSLSPVDSFIPGVEKVVERILAKQAVTE